MIEWIWCNFTKLKILNDIIYKLQSRFSCERGRISSLCFFKCRIVKCVGLLRPIICTMRRLTSQFAGAQRPVFLKVSTAYFFNDRVIDFWFAVCGLNILACTSGDCRFCNYSRVKIKSVAKVELFPTLLNRVAKVELFPTPLNRLSKVIHVALIFFPQR